MSLFCFWFYSSTDELSHFPPVQSLERETQISAADHDCLCLGKCCSLPTQRSLANIWISCPQTSAHSTPRVRTGDNKAIFGISLSTAPWCQALVRDTWPSSKMPAAFLLLPWTMCSIRARHGSFCSQLSPQYIAQSQLVHIYPNIFLECWTSLECFLHELLCLAKSYSVKTQLRRLTSMMPLSYLVI